GGGPSTRATAGKMARPGEHACFGTREAPSLRVEDLPGIGALRDRAGEGLPVEAAAPPGPATERLIGKAAGSLVGFPLKSNGLLRGVLYLAAGEPGVLGPEQRVVGQEVANQFTIAVQQARLREQLRRHAEELERRVDERTARLRETNAALEAFSYSV